MPDGTRCVIPCNSSTPHGAHCRQSLPNWDQYPTCKGCFRNWGVDYMPLRTLLAAANVSLDEKTGNTSLPRRFWGSLLRVNAPEPIYVVISEMLFLFGYTKYWGRLSVVTPKGALSQGFPRICGSEPLLRDLQEIHSRLA